jgi:hypothetical protein
MDWKNPRRGPCGRVVVNLGQVSVSYDKKHNIIYDAEPLVNQMIEVE